MRGFELYYIDQATKSEVSLGILVAERMDLSNDDCLEHAKNFIRRHYDEEEVEKWLNWGPGVREASSAA